MALRNTIRRPARFVLSVGLLASAGMVFVAGMSLSTGTEAIAEEQKQQRNWDVDVQLTSPAAMDEIINVLEGQAVAGAVDATLTDAGMEVQAAASISRSEAISAGHLGPIILILLGIALPLGVVGVIGLVSTMGANILDRTREFGVLHAIGARPKTVRRIVVAEGTFLAIASCLVAVVPPLGLTAVLGAGLGNLFFSAPLPFRISTVAVVIWIAVVILCSLLATEAAATRASRLTVREALAYL